jgi:hypothetical protein
MFIGSKAVMWPAAKRDEPATTDSNSSSMFECLAGGPVLQRSEEDLSEEDLTFTSATIPSLFNALLDCWSEVDLSTRLASLLARALVLARPKSNTNRHETTTYCREASTTTSKQATKRSTTTISPSQFCHDTMHHPGSFRAITCTTSLR